jgi:hypothetical protein
MHFEYNNPGLGIFATMGALSISCQDLDIIVISELSLGKLQEIYPRWQILVNLLKSDLPSSYLNNKNVRDKVDSLLKDFGINSHKLTFNQIEALLFYDSSGETTKPSILWQFHNVFPRTLDLPTDEQELDSSNFIDLDIFETAILYLAQDNKEHLIHEWPLSRVMKVLLSRSFIQWVASPDNKVKMLEKQNLKYVQENPIDLDDLAAKIKAQMSKPRKKG